MVASLPAEDWGPLGAADSAPHARYAGGEVPFWRFVASEGFVERPNPRWLSVYDRRLRRP
jgi:hypothetical protein